MKESPDAAKELGSDHVSLRKYNEGFEVWKDFEN
jgi:hypothetical protein